MSLSIPNTTVTSQSYTPALTFAGTDILAQGYFTIANNPCFVQMLHGAYGQPRPGAETYLPPGTYPLAAGERDLRSGLSRDPVNGIRFRAATANTPSPQVFGTLFYPGEAQILAGQPFSAVVGATGSVSGTGELDRQAVTAPVSVTVAATELAPLTVITFSSLNFDGATAVYVETWWPDITWASPAAGNQVGLSLWDGSSDLGRVFRHATNQPAIGVLARTLITPPAGATAYRIRAWAITNTATLNAGVGGAGAYRGAGGRITTP